MKRKAIEFFRRGRWLRLATQYITNPQRMRELVKSASQYTNRRGMKKLSKNVTSLWQYLTDVVTGQYTHYNKRALLLTVAGLLYLITPLDCLPDILICGLIDDLAVVLYIVNSIKNELTFYNQYCQGRILK